MKARVFVNGRSQAVRIPKEFRFTTNEVSIRRDEATGDLILSARIDDFTWPKFFETLDGIRDDQWDFLEDRRLTEAKREEIF